MSSNYSANQYNDSYYPQRLRNWEVPTDHDYDCRPRPCIPCGPTYFIADRNGRLFPHVKAKTIFRNAALRRIWLAGCPCALRQRRKQNSNSECYPSSSTFRRRRIRSIPNINPSPNIDPYLCYLREIRLPTIFVIGYPKKCIGRRRKLILRNIACDLGFTYIDLDEQIWAWALRQCEENEILDQNTYCGVPTYRNLKKRNDCPSTSPYNTSKCSDKFCINFDTATPLTPSGVIDLLKFAMVEALPASGFILDGFPCTLTEAAEFERVLYPASLILSFHAGKASADELPSQGPFQFQYPRMFRRKVHYTLEAGERFARTQQFAKKLIRVLDTERVDSDTLKVLSQLVGDNIRECQSGGGLSL